MRFNILSAAFAATALLPAAAIADEDCTFAISIGTIGNWDTSAMKCSALIYKGHVDLKDDKEYELAASEDMTCDVSGGCDDVEYNGSKYTFCHDGIREMKDISSEASVQREGDNSANIHPDGDDEADSSASPVHAGSSHIYWKEGSCK